MKNPKTNFMKKILLLCTAVITTFTFTFAKEPSDSLQLLLEKQLKLMDSIEGTLHYKTGTISLGNGIATIEANNGFRFLESDEAEYVLTELWGNLKGTKPLGLLFPPNSGATSIEGYSYLIEYDAIGYVKDKDADKIDYDDLLKEMKEGQAKANEERKKLGLETMTVIGWAAKPSYDKERKILYWAKEFKVSEQDENSLNYDIKLLGRKGVLTVSALASINQLDTINKNLNNVLSMVAFNAGSKYSDFDSKTDDIAAWTIGGLVAGKVLAKVGFFALIIKNIKLVILGVVAVGGGIWRFITGRRKKEEEFVYEPQTTPSAEGTNNPHPNQNS